MVNNNYNDYNRNFSIEVTMSMRIKRNSMIIVDIFNLFIIILIRDPV